MPALKRRMLKGFPAFYLIYFKIFQNIIWCTKAGHQHQKNTMPSTRSRHRTQKWHYCYQLGASHKSSAFLTRFFAPLTIKTRQKRCKADGTALAIASSFTNFHHWSDYAKNHLLESRAHPDFTRRLLLL
jgi:hypothetical protein